METEASGEESEETENTADNAGLAGVVGELTEKVAALSSDLAMAQAENKRLAEEVASHEASVESMRKIVEANLNRMSIALGGSSRDLGAFDASSLVAEYFRVEKEFVGRFPSAAKASTEKEQESGEVVHLSRARVNAVKISKGDK